MRLLLLPFAIVRLLRSYRVLKSFSFPWPLRHRGVWLGFGGQSERTRFIESAWLKTMFPPYLDGRGINVSLFGVSLRIGTYVDMGLYIYDDYDNVDVAGELRALGWGLVDEQPEVIGSWESSRSGKSEPARSTRT
jgi:hypothetical protein